MTLTQRAPSGSGSKCCIWEVKKIVLHVQDPEDLVWCSSFEKFLSIFVPVCFLYQSTSQQEMTVLSKRLTKKSVMEGASWQPASNGESPRHWHHGFPTGAEAIVEGHTFLFFLMVQYLLLLPSELMLEPSIGQTQPEAREQGNLRGYVP